MLSLKMKNKIVKVCLTFMFLMSSNLRLCAQEAYASLSENNTVLSFYFDDQKNSRNGMDIGPFSYGDERWGGHESEIVTVSFDDSFSKCSNITSTAYWFMRCNNLIKITGIDNLDTSNVTDMSYMFYECLNLDSLDLSTFNTSNVTMMSVMFYKCRSLSFLDVSKFDTSNVLLFDLMFSGCESLTSIDVSGFDTSKATKMQGMFNSCISLITIDVSNFDTSNVTDMSCMFGPCFSLSSLDISNFDTSNVTNLYAMFYKCYKLTSLDLSNFNTEMVEDMSELFHGCTSLTSLDISSFDTKNVKNMNFMFSDCSSIETIDLSNFNSGNVTEMVYMFQNCSVLKTIYAQEGWNTSHVNYGYSMFMGCENLVGGNGTRFNPLHDDYSYAWIDGVADRPGYFTDKSASSIRDVRVLSDANSDGEWYTLDGLHVEGKRVKGLFIKNRQKVLVK